MGIVQQHDDPHLEVSVPLRGFRHERVPNPTIAYITVSKKFPSPCGVLGMKVVTLTDAATVTPNADTVSVPLRGFRHERCSFLHSWRGLSARLVSVPLRGFRHESFPITPWD